MSAAFEPEYEYIVVGSGAGGGTVAARLAEAGRRVLLLEAGGDPRAPDRGGEPGATPRLPDDYDVPAFHSSPPRTRDLAWNFFVSHHDDPAANRSRPEVPSRARADRRVDGFLYPRAGTLGGCTAHNAMIWVYPHNADWDGIAALTGDASWAAPAMRRYFERIERLPPPSALPGARPPRREPHAPRLGRVAAGRALGAARGPDRSPAAARRHRGRAGGHARHAAAHGIACAGSLTGSFDPNDWRLVQRQRDRHPLPAAHHRRQPAGRDARACARGGRPPPVVPDHRARTRW